MSGSSALARSIPCFSVKPTVYGMDQHKTRSGESGGNNTDHDCVEFVKRALESLSDIKNVYTGRLFRVLSEGLCFSEVYFFSCLVVKVSLTNARGL